MKDGVGELQYDGRDGELQYDGQWWGTPISRTGVLVVFSRVNKVVMVHLRMF